MNTFSKNGGNKRPKTPINRELSLKYLSGKMSPVELAALKAHLGEEPFETEALEGLKSLEDPQKVQHHLSDLDQRLSRQLENTANRSTPHFRVYLSIAAAILLLFASVWVFNSRADNHQLFSRYFDPYPELITSVRGIQLNQDLKSALKLYKQDNFRLALSALNKVLADDPENSVALFYSGNILLAHNHPGEAVLRLSKITDDPPLSLREPIKWYLALGQLRLGNYQQCDSLLASLQGEPNLFLKKASRIRQFIEDQNVLN